MASKRVVGRCVKVNFSTHMPKNILLFDGGMSRPVKSAQTGSEDPHRTKWKFVYFLLQSFLCLVYGFRPFVKVEVEAGVRITKCMAGV